jgi:hypothetical protein
MPKWYAVYCTRKKKWTYHGKSESGAACALVPGTVYGAGDTAEGAWDSCLERVTAWKREQARTQSIVERSK